LGELFFELRGIHFDRGLTIIEGGAVYDSVPEMARINKIILPTINKMLVSTHGPQVKRFRLCVITTRVSRPHMFALRLIVAIGIFWVLMP